MNTPTLPKLLLALLILVTPFALGCAQTDSAPQGTALQSPALQGTWTVIAGEHGGKPMDAMNGGTLRIDGERFRIDTSSGNVLEGGVTLDSSQQPAVMVMEHDSGLHWEAIYELDGDTFRMNYIDATGPDPLPEAFRTSDETEATIVVLERQRVRR